MNHFYYASRKKGSSKTIPLNSKPNLVPLVLRGEPDVLKVQIGDREGETEFVRFRQSAAIWPWLE